jgi:hypothetical protein
MTDYRFPPTSRYHGVEIAKLALPDGREIAHLRRRFVPDPERFALLHERVVAAGERPDHLAASELGDPEAFWRIADSNRALKPEELAEVGRRLRITLPEGIPAPPAT